MTASRSRATRLPESDVSATRQNPGTFRFSVVAT
jgi:hypothetical protein